MRGEEVEVMGILDLYNINENIIYISPQVLILNLYLLIKMVKLRNAAQLLLESCFGLFLEKLY